MVTVKVSTTDMCGSAPSQVWEQVVIEITPLWLSYV